MDLIAFALWWLLEVFFYLLLGRLVIDLVLSANPAFRPRGIILVVFEIVLTVTDPPLKIMRRIIPTLKFGGFQLDLGWTVLVFAVFFLQSLVR